jgi:hypothetical protein
MPKFEGAKVHCQAMFNPLQGVMKESKLSFEEAIKRSGITNLKHEIQESKRFAEKQKHEQLDEDEVASLNFYSKQSAFFSTLNCVLRSRNGPEIKRRFFPYLRLVLGGAFKCPLQLGTFTRGIGFDILQHIQTSGPFYWWAFTSTTKQVDQTDQFLGHGEGTLLIIKGAGVDLGPFTDFKTEKEVLLLPGSVFEMEGEAVQRGPLNIIQLTQLPTPRVFEFMHPEIGVLDTSMRHTGEWTRAWGTVDGALVGTACAAPVAIVAGGALVMASTATAFAGATALFTTEAAAAAVAAETAVANAGCWSLAGVAASWTGAAATATAAAAEAAALAATAAEVTAVVSTASTVTTAAAAGTTLAAAGGGKTFFPYWWSCCGNRTGNHTLNCCGCGFGHHRVSRQCKPPAGFIEIDGKKLEKDTKYVTGDRVVGADTVGKFDFISKVWAKYSALDDTEKKKYMVYRAKSDEHGDENWQPVIVQRNMGLYYEGEYRIKKQQCT